MNPADKIPMVGNRYGDLLVLKDLPPRYYPSSAHRMVLVRCVCGKTYATDAAPLRRGGVKRCSDCNGEENRRRGREDLSVRLPDGRTIAQVAQASGLKVMTVYRRYLRGWPPEYLGMQLRPGRKYGGSTDLPERRRTVYPGAEA